ncbi:GNAT family N-acetyltransferase [Kitasatospora sp. NBC_00315]|uniref:GNAT family N-acetyltransferase n=1 Tax=Kitasatospora sp. NBC_00315 TaxID=2975963 RepID=UPI0032453B75
MSGGTAADPAVVEIRRVSPDDALAEPLLRGLTEEYLGRYGERAHEEMARYPSSEFHPPHGLLLLLLEDGVPVAGGAYRRYDGRTAEVKRMWTAVGHRRRGLARRVLAELEAAAAAAGHGRMYLTTGPLQPEAKGLYLATGYTPLFDVTADPSTVGPLAFEKRLAAPPAGRPDVRAAQVLKP